MWASSYHSHSSSLRWSFTQPPPGPVGCSEDGVRMIQFFLLTLHHQKANDMDKIKFYKECKGALDILNSKGIIKPEDYPLAVVAKLREIGAKPVTTGFVSCRQTREAEAIGVFDDMIEDERQRQRTERRAKRAEIISIISIAIALAALLLPVILR